jgi:hypothetical protein
MKKISYIGLFLTEESRKVLLDRIKPKHGTVTADHITLAFAPSEEVLEILKPKLGRLYSIKLSGQASDEKGQAVAVERDELPFIENAFPHITVSCAAGVKPVYSNELLKMAWARGDGEAADTKHPIVLQAVLDTFPRQKNEA